MNDDATARQHWAKYHHLWHFMQVPSKTVLLEEGTIARKLYRIIKGAARVWFNHDGKEISFQFFFEGDVVSSIESFRKAVPSTFSIETIEACELHWIYKADLDFVIQDDIFLRRRMMDWTVDRQAEFIKHLFSFLKDTPQQRYANLLSKKPEIVQRIPLQYIASYLGITAVSLSRIRNKV
jgi:CRP-like cAMP-binding protein